MAYLCEQFRPEEAVCRCGLVPQFFEGAKAEVEEAVFQVLRAEFDAVIFHSDEVYFETVVVVPCGWCGAVVVGVIEAGEGGLRRVEGVTCGDGAEQFAFEAAVRQGHMRAVGVKIAGVLKVGGSWRAVHAVDVGENQCVASELDVPPRLAGCIEMVCQGQGYRRVEAGGGCDFFHEKQPGLACAGGRQK